MVRRFEKLRAEGVIETRDLPEAFYPPIASIEQLPFISGPYKMAAALLAAVLGAVPFAPDSGANGTSPHPPWCSELVECGSAADCK